MWLILYRPTTVIDLATLTGACVVALGEYAAGLFTNNDALRDRLQKAASDSNERVWPVGDCRYALIALLHLSAPTL